MTIYARMRFESAANYVLGNVFAVITCAEFHANDHCDDGKSIFLAHLHFFFRFVSSKWNAPSFLPVLVSLLTELERSLDRINGFVLSTAVAEYRT